MPEEETRGVRAGVDCMERLRRRRRLKLRRVSSAPPADSSWQCRRSRLRAPAAGGTTLSPFASRSCYAMYVRCPALPHIPQHLDPGWAQQDPTILLHRSQGRSALDVNMLEDHVMFHVRRCYKTFLGFLHAGAPRGAASGRGLSSAAEAVAPPCWLPSSAMTASSPRDLSLCTTWLSPVCAPCASATST